MNWLARLKIIESTPAPALQNLQKAANEAFVGFVGACPEPFENSFPENDLLAARLGLFTERNLSLRYANVVAQQLEHRDLMGDDRRLCLECKYLSGGTTARRCGKWQELGLLSAAIPDDTVDLLQRCKSFDDRLERMA